MVAVLEDVLTMFERWKKIKSRFKKECPYCTKTLHEIIHTAHVFVAIGAMADGRLHVLSNFDRKAKFLLFERILQLAFWNESQPEPHGLGWKEYVKTGEKHYTGEGGMYS